MNETKFEELKGKTLVAVNGLEKGSESVTFEATDGSKFSMYHSQDCCEDVDIEDICGDVGDLIGSEILMAEEVSDYEGPPSDSESYTWTFYKLRTMKGDVTIRWFGSSNGYYSESVYFEKIK